MNRGLGERVFMISGAADRSGGPPGDGRPRHGRRSHGSPRHGRPGEAPGPDRTRQVSGATDVRT
jgi:hypothetical protein